jgi:hypothetical protein
MGWGGRFILHGTNICSMSRILFFLLFLPAWAGAQKSGPVLAMDFVQVKDQHFAEAMYFYNQNWKLYREAALQKGFITGYRMVQIQRDSMAPFDLVLITEYADSAQYKQSEKNFEGIIRELRPDGPLLLNGLKPGDFRRNLFFKEALQLAGSTEKRWKKITKRS